MRAAFNTNGLSERSNYSVHLAGESTLIWGGMSAIRRLGNGDQDFRPRLELRILVLTSMLKDCLFAPLGNFCATVPFIFEASIRIPVASRQWRRPELYFVLVFRYLQSHQQVGTVPVILAKS